MSKKLDPSAVASLRSILAARAKKTDAQIAQLNRCASAPHPLAARH